MKAKASLTDVKYIRTQVNNRIVLMKTDNKVVVPLRMGTVMQQPLSSTKLYFCSPKGNRQKDVFDGLFYDGYGRLSSLY
jgi:hypothetical protein